MDIQTEVQKIHHQFGVTEKANYEIQKLFDKAIKEAVTEALRKHDVSKSACDKIFEEAAKIDIGNDIDYGQSEQLICDSCGCHPNVIYTTSKGRFCERCKPTN